MNPQILYWLLLAVTVVSSVVEICMSLLNDSVHRDDIDPRVAGFYDRDKYVRSISYRRDKDRLSRLSSFFGFALGAGMLAFGGFGALDGLLSGIAGYGRLRTLAFLGIILAGSELLSVPFELYATFVIEERYGFNKTTPSVFIADKVKGFLLALVFGGGILFLFIVLVEALGSWFWLSFAALAIAIVLFVNMFYTSLILPLFNKLERLPEGELSDAVARFAERTGLEVGGIYVMDGSKRSSKANAFFSGIGPKKKIVLFDTLIRNHPVPELIAILAHETGHLKKKHIVKGFFLSAALIAATAWLFSLFIVNASPSLALGGSDYALHLNLVAFGILFAPVSAATGLLSTLASRRHEYEADAYAAETSSARDLATALKRLGSDSLVNLYPHPLYVFLNYSHPPLLQRLERLGDGSAAFPVAEYRALVDGFYRLMMRNRRLADVRLPDGDWTLKEMVGHLVDSFTNNHQRFIRLQLEDHLAFPGYDCEKWKDASKLSPVDYRFLVNFWRDCNVYLLALIERMDSTKLENVWESPDGPKTLAFLVEDYFGHIRWHIDFFERRVAELRKR